MDADKIGEVGGYKVSGPDFETRVVDGAVIIMLENESIAGNIRAKLEPLGYRVYHGINAFIAEGKKL
jgi:hypothetical protein